MLISHNSALLCQWQSVSGASSNTQAMMVYIRPAYYRHRAARLHQVSISPPRFGIYVLQRRQQQQYQQNETKEAKETKQGNERLLSVY